jgi:hypothetical protein
MPVIGFKTFLGRGGVLLIRFTLPTIETIFLLPVWALDSMYYFRLLFFSCITTLVYGPGALLSVPYLFWSRPYHCFLLFLVFQHQPCTQETSFQPFSTFLVALTLYFLFKNRRCHLQAITSYGSHASILYSFRVIKPNRISNALKCKSRIALFL